MKSIILALVLLLLATASAGGFFAWEINQPKGTGEKKEIIFEEGLSVREIANRLDSEGLIRSADFFVLYVKLSGFESQIQAGRYEIPPSLSIAQIAEVLRHGTFDVRLTFLEGWRKEEFLGYALQRLPVDSAAFSGEFLAATKDLEGYLFPDTYLVAQNISAGDLVDLLKANFDKRYAQLAEKISLRGLTQKEAVILASMIEREAYGSTDSAIIAGILLKRLELGWTLDVDATVQYALGYQESEGTWWKRDLTSADLNVSSPYNTRRKQGLPPGPIASPGSVALGAVAEPQSTDYLYYLHDQDGIARYAKTLAEHNANVAKYLR
ncbi:hypothetical protein A2797_01605 [candidate division WWE3 bacterium RIFCSPHIGHO2_01_FULL_48_15]|uniref:Endolytic murein transglycosylase n=1 Tax=candidate division WWE3 bacterium RIFCSPHIGHO2_01_FULL_48_15 TaxID=1802619 RepID=A0A1F4VBS3_UNCKA|nr:MAG: hypothetical protein A2797_01605 [candidate division WWE3 bacterium RIFCSPHIGHO2_01_FULL_48_15]